MATKKALEKKATPISKITAVKQPMTKSAIIGEIAENTELTRKQVSSVFDELAILMQRHIKKRAPGQFTLAGLMKIEVKHKPATKARKGINPFTGEETVFKAKPARRVVKIRPLKKVKEMLG
jgi:nucleoid DNA-binding protein